MKRAVLATGFLIVSGQFGLASAYESGARDLGGAVGATDYYQVNCSAADTERLNFKIADTTPLPIDTQFLNLRVAKKALTDSALTIAPGNNKVLALAGGNGKYKVTVDTDGSQLAGKQAYTLNFQCSNGSGQATKASVKSASGKLKRGKKKTYAVSCSRKKAAGDTVALSAILTNVTKGGSVLSAQIVKSNTALSTTDGNEIDVRAGSGDYYLTVDHTGTDSNQPSRLYTFQASCLNSAGETTADPTVLQLQDQ